MCEEPSPFTSFNLEQFTQEDWDEIVADARLQSVFGDTEPSNQCSKIIANQLVIYLRKLLTSAIRKNRLEDNTSVPSAANNSTKLPVKAEDIIKVLEEEVLNNAVDAEYSLRRAQDVLATWTRLHELSQGYNVETILQDHTAHRRKLSGGDT